MVKLKLSQLSEVNMGKYDSIVMIESRYDAYGIKTYWNQGYKGKGIKVAIIDEFTIEHGNQMASCKDYVAPECEVIKLEMGKNSYYAIIEQIKEAIKLKVDIISISRSSDVNTKPMQDAIKECKNAGILVFCSAGNDGDKYVDSVDIKMYPAYYPETISVMSIDNSYMPSSFASHNTMADICGYGQNVLVKNKSGEEVLVSGTSPTTATCAFVAALHIQKVSEETGKKPTYDYMMNFIKTNVVDLNKVGKDNFTGYGFFTLDRKEFDRIKIKMFDADENGLVTRLEEIKKLVLSGMPLEQAEKRVNVNYYIVGYEIINRVEVPIYGGKKPIY